MAGEILYWDGNIADIPDGFALCDGNNGTPNLLGTFLRGASTAGATGGADTRSLTNPPQHDHTGNTDTAGAHGHPFDQTIYNSSSGFDNDGQDNAADTTNNSWSHSHTGSTGSTGSGNSWDNKPESVVLAPIQRL